MTRLLLVVVCSMMLARRLQTHDHQSLLYFVSLLHFMSFATVFILYCVYVCYVRFLIHTQYSYFVEFNAIYKSVIYKFRK